MCGALRRRLSPARFFLLGSVSNHGLAQLTYRESLRDITACLRSMSGKLYHMGWRGDVARSTLAHANERIYGLRAGVDRYRATSIYRRSNRR